MTDIAGIDYSAFDRSNIPLFLFHPRPEWPLHMPGHETESVMIPVAQDVEIGARFYVRDKDAPGILFFHGNGEIVADYDEIGMLYAKMGLNFMPVDYRGYGRSTGQPTVTAMMRDAHVVFDYVLQWRKARQHGGPLIVMGRSLGSASAIELAYHHPQKFDGLIVESGFACIGPLLRLMGVDMAALGLSEAMGPRNLDKISSFGGPTLIIHAEYDQIIPFHEGQALFDACPSQEKKLLMIPGANHNDIFFHGFVLYTQAMMNLVETIGRKRADPVSSND
jgi:alpha-beta hydrolase superfamily lysophospholipase